MNSIGSSSSSGSPSTAASRTRRSDPTMDRASHVDPPLAPRESVERAHGVVAVEAQIACEVVAGAEGNADEREVALDGDRGDGREGAVAPGDPDRVGVRPARELGRILALPQ